LLFLDLLSLIHRFVELSRTPSRPSACFFELLFSASLELARPSSNFGALQICLISDISSSNFSDTDIDFPLSFGASSTFFDLQIYSIYLIYSSIFHCQLLTMALASKPWEIDFHDEQAKLALDLRHRSGREV
jgi:hypothetical protein